MDNNRNTLKKGTATEKASATEKAKVQQSSDEGKNQPSSGDAKATSRLQDPGDAKGTEKLQDPRDAKVAEKLQDPDELIKPLKELLTALEKRQKVIQEMGDYRTVLQSLVSGELLSGEELERAKQVIQSLGKLVKATMDHQKALATASEVMPALDQILAVKQKS